MPKMVCFFYALWLPIISKYEKDKDKKQDQKRETVPKAKDKDKKQDQKRETVPKVKDKDKKQDQKQKTVFYF